MPDISNDPWYKQEIVPPNLWRFIIAVRIHFALPAAAVGSRGNPKTHFRGAHRSRNFIKNSPACTNRTYTVSRTPGDRSGGDGNWTAGVDITFATRAELLTACRRLDAEVRAGRLEKVTEWYGNTNDDQRVDGYDNIANQVAESDDSHLWHLHITLDRGKVNWDHTDLLRVLTGGEDWAMTVESELTAIKADIADVYRVIDTGLRGINETKSFPKPGGAPGETWSRPTNWLVRRLLELEEAITAQRTEVVLTDEQLVALSESVTDQVIARLAALRFVPEES